MIKVICLGPKGCGKTLLLKKLQNVDSVNETSSSIPTVGTNLYDIKYNHKSVTVREMGGEIAPYWAKFYEGINKIMFVVDASNLCQISAAGVLLYSILVDPRFEHSKVILALTKMDVSYRQMRNEGLLMLQLKRLQEEASQSIVIVETSAISGLGREQILEWLFE